MVIEAVQYREDISRELNKVLTHSLFKGARRSSSFLRYVCEKTIAGESHQIKEFSIAVDAFGLEMSFDQQIDPRIRVEAKRLRDRLKQYYDGPGCEDPVLILMEKGSYIPCFMLHDNECIKDPVTENQNPEDLPGENQIQSEAKTILLDQRFLIHLDLQVPEGEYAGEIGLFNSNLTLQLFKLGQTHPEQFSLTKLIQAQKVAFPLTLTIRHHSVKDTIHFILELKLQQNGALIHIKEFFLSAAELKDEKKQKTTVLREADELQKFCRSVQS